MSEVVEKEGIASALVSSLGAWTGLGAGLALLFATFLTVLAASHAHNPNHTPRALLQEALLSDLASAKHTSVSLSEQGQKLKIYRASGEGGKVDAIIYSCNNDEKKLYRKSQATGTLDFGSAVDLKFSKRGHLLEARWGQGKSAESQSWALRRWKTK